MLPRAAFPPFNHGCEQHRPTGTRQTGGGAPGKHARTSASSAATEAGCSRGPYALHQTTCRSTMNCHGRVSLSACRTLHHSV